jgi:hypothetical protein
VQTHSLISYRQKQYRHFTEAAGSLTRSLKPANELYVQPNISLIPRSLVTFPNGLIFIVIGCKTASKPEAHGM